MARTGKASLMVIFVTVFIDLLGFGIIMPLLPRYGKHFIVDDASGFKLGLLMASFSAMQFLFAPIWGRVSDRVGRRPILMLGLAGSTISYALFGLATGWDPDTVVLGLSPLAWLFATRIGAGIAGATIPTAQAYIADVTDIKNRGKGMAMIGAAFGIGFTFGPLIGAFSVGDNPEAPPSSMPGYVASAMSGLALLFAFFKLPESLNPDSNAVHRGWLNVSALIPAITRPSIGPILLTIFLSTVAFAQLESTLALLTEHFGLSQQDNFYVFAYIGVLLMLSQGLLIRRLLPRVGEKRMAIAGVFMMVAGLLAIGWIAEGGTLTQMYLILPLSVIGFSALNPSIQSLLSLRSAESDQGGILGIGQSMSSIARILGPIIGIVLFESEVTFPYWCSAGIMFLAGLLVLFIKPARSEDVGTPEPVEPVEAT
ncbi:Tetracycline resistance protein, class B [Polystyrenella longa]|uniref:Tetracycline resistance protein, class B n=1 Tax=Polystyrenella longa TaxID=2528007 RepID=A0A518CIJ7_9PLAN|nr:MFS transporter [Polystyrenella longa]QDU79055.1 Tetracycline resistance protein, class B [Polystyrenella longa]